MRGIPAIDRICHNSEALTISIGCCLLVAGFFIWRPFLWIAATLNLSIATYLRTQTSRKEDRLLTDK